MLGALDYMEGGSTIEDAVAAAKLFEQDGADLLSVSGGLCGPFKFHAVQPGYFQDASRPIREAVQIPVLLTGGVKTGEQAEELLEKGAADLIGAGRVQLRDDHWAKRAIASVEGE